MDAWIWNLKTNDSGLEKITTFPVPSSETEEKHIRTYKPAEQHTGKRREIGLLATTLCRVYKSTEQLSRAAREVRELQVGRRSTT